MEFCKVFNVKIDFIEKGLLILVVIIVYVDCFFIFVIKILLAVVLLKKAVGIKFGFGKLNKDKVGKIFCVQLQEIVQIKAVDMIGVDIEVMICFIEGIVCFMGLVVED